MSPRFAFAFLPLLLPTPAQAQVANQVPPPTAQVVNPPPPVQYAPLSPDDQRLQLFQSVFGGKKIAPKPIGPHQILDVPLILDGLEVARIKAKTGATEADIKIVLESLLWALGPAAEPRVLDRLKTHADADGLIGVNDIEGDGLSAKFDVESLALILTLPVPLRRVQEISVGPRAPAIGPDGVVPTAGVSAYVNFLGDLSYANGTGQASGLQENLAVDGAINFRGTVLQGSVNYSNPAQDDLQRGAVRLIHDDTDDAVRYTAGDLNYGVDGFQSFVPMAGLSIARNFTLQPYFISQPTGAQQFVLNQASQVQVFVNGVQNEVLNLPAGQYDFHNFPFTEGMNDVQIRATDSVGRVTTISSPYFFSSTLLAAGVQAFSYSIGLPSTITANGYAYDTTAPSVSAYHQIGVTDNLTIGANFQGSLLQQTLGGEFTYASELGTVHMDLASSHTNDAGFGDAVRLSYNLTDSRAQGSGSSLLVQATYTGPTFATLGVTTPLNETAVDLGARYAQRVFGTVYASVGASYDIGRDGQRNGHDLNFTLEHAFAPGLIANLRVDQSIDRGGKPSIDALISISWQMGDGHSTVQSSYDSATQNSQASYQYTPTNYVGEPGGNLDVSRLPSGEQATGTAFYNANRFEASLSENALLRSAGGVSDGNQQTNLRVGTSLAFADGYFGIGRPIGDSFAIVAPNENYADQNIIVDASGSEGKFEAKTDFLGAAVQPDLTAYQIQPLLAAIPDLPIGYQLDRDRFQVLPTYLSGTLIVIGNDATVVLDGTLMDRNGAPLALLAGEIVSLDKKGAPVGEFFTNRLGRFRIEGIGPGAFELRLAGDPTAHAHVVVPPKTKGIYVVGKIKLETEAGEER